MPVRRWSRWIAAVLAALMPWLSWGQEASEASVKAALLYKFASYVEWPAEAFPAGDAPLVIGVTGADEVAGELEQLVKGRAINMHPLTVRRLKEGDPIAGLHVLLVGRGASGRLQAMARAARPLSILVVSDTERGLESGSVINFVRVEDRVGFEVSMEAAENSSLRISSRMLAVARRVLARTS